MSSIGCDFAVATYKEEGYSYGIWYADKGIGHCDTSDVFVPNRGWFVGDLESTTTETDLQDRVDIDRAILRLSRSLYCISMIFTFFALLIVVSETFFCKVHCGKCILVPLFAAGWFFGACTYVIFSVSGCWDEFDWSSGEYKCEMGRSAILYLSATILYFFLTFFQCFMPRAAPMFAKNNK